MAGREEKHLVPLLDHGRDPAIRLDDFRHGHPASFNVSVSWHTGGGLSSPAMIQYREHMMAG